MVKRAVRAIIEGGAATAGPPLGPALGPLGVNLMAIVNEINELTRDFAGMKVPVEVIVDVETKEFEVKIGTPSTAALIAKELGIQKGSERPRLETVGDLPIEKVVKIAKAKVGSRSVSLKSCVKEVLGTCISMGVTVEGKDPRDAIQAINRGEYEELLKG